MSSTQGTRPGGITLIVVLAVINALASIGGGIFVILDRDDIRLLRESGMTQNQLVAAGVAAIVLGVIGLWVALALGRGSSFARLLFGIWAVLQFAGGVYAAVALHGEQRAQGAISASIGLVVIYLLYGSERDREYFLHHS
jgi:hypothetical protein